MSEKKNFVTFQPGWAFAFSFFWGTDHYGFRETLGRKALKIPLSSIKKIYQIECKPIIGLGAGHRYMVEYRSEMRDCLISLETLPEEVDSFEKIKVSSAGALLLMAKGLIQEPMALLLPLGLPVSMMLLMLMYLMWSQYVLQNPDVLAFFVREGCDKNCVYKVLSFHSLVFFLFILQLSVMILPLAFYYFQSSRFRTAFSYRMAQTYTVASVMVGVFVFVQLMIFFPFKQYSRFIGLGFGPKVEKILKKSTEKPAKPH
ncbi:MAG: hypothetical protein M9962_00465 [Oligoflexia bacterium]|nr:hypothetical protein [Oligoflexia bacterium]